MTAKPKSLVSLFLVLFVAAIAAGAWDAPGEAASGGGGEPLEVFADISPVAFLVER